MWVKENNLRSNGNLRDSLLKNEKLAHIFHYHNTRDPSENAFYVYIEPFTSHIFNLFFRIDHLHFIDFRAVVDAFLVSKLSTFECIKQQPLN